MENQKTAVEAPAKIAKGRGKETMLKVAARNQIEMIAIADNKANIITGINAIILSFCIALLSSGFQIEGIPILDRPELVLPFAILLVFSTISAVCGILAAKPVMIRTRHGSPATSSLLFFDHSRKETLEEYKAQVRELMTSNERIYEQLMTEMYSNGMVLRRKYSLLSLSYTLFLMGLVICTLSTLLILLFPPTVS